ncbi:MAG: hypothetical protein IT424_10880 [Pirellulales bacterium]|nr:hypothetical protein [Pirellulales bacterium]
MLKRVLLVVLVAVGGISLAAPPAGAAIVVGRIAPVRRVVYRTALPPYPVARRVVAGPIYRPYAYPAYRSPVIYGAPMIYGPTVVFGF